MGTRHKMKRIIYYDLCDWRETADRMPILIRGARQIGKTHVVRQLGADFNNFVEINFERQQQISKVFDNDLDPLSIIRDLAVATKSEIIPGKTLLFLDEIQQAPRAITALRYFYEELPELHVIAAGSLVDFALDEVGVPVGRIAYLFMYPMSFMEFLFASGYKKLAVNIVNQDVNDSINETIHELALRLLGEYLAIGGMPKAVHHWVQNQDVLASMKVLQNIKNVYEDDFAKYAKKHEVKYVDLLFKNLPSVICEKFNYSKLATAYRKRELAPALRLLEKAGIIHRVFHSHGTGVPLGAEVDFNTYKIVTLDVGLAQSILGLDLQDWFLDPSNAFVNKGSLTESFIGQEFLAYAAPNQKAQLYYWQREKRGSNAEVDFLTAINAKIIPIEVKSGRGSSLQSMRIFLKEHEQSNFGIRFSIHNYSIFDGIHSYPLYAVAASLPDKQRLIKFLESESS